jgi:hypothetical protein
MASVEQVRYDKAVPSRDFGYETVGRRQPSESLLEALKMTSDYRREVHIGGRAIAIVAPVAARDAEPESDEMTKADIEAEIQRYERKFNMRSDELLRLSAEGRAPDEQGISTWLLLLRFR